MKVDELLWQHCLELCSGPKEPPSGTPIPKTYLGDIGIIRVYLVDGNAVKIKYDADFVEGNNSMESPKWIPKHEVWISDELVRKYWAPVLYHECHEWRDMRQGMSYEKAHARANDGEMQLRKRYLADHSPHQSL